MVKHATTSRSGLLKQEVQLEVEGNALITITKVRHHLRNLPGLQIRARTIVRYGSKMGLTWHPNFPEVTRIHYSGNKIPVFQNLVKKHHKMLQEASFGVIWRNFEKSDLYFQNNGPG